MSQAVSFRRRLCQSEDSEYESLLVLLVNGFLCEDEPDDHI